MVCHACNRHSEEYVYDISRLHPSLGTEPRRSLKTVFLSQNHLEGMFLLDRPDTERCFDIEQKKSVYA